MWETEDNFLLRPLSNNRCVSLSAKDRITIPIVTRRVKRLPVMAVTANELTGLTAFRSEKACPLWILEA
jgi:hypothetical protein